MTLMYKKYELSSLLYWILNTSENLLGKHSPNEVILRASLLKFEQKKKRKT